jgi:hypothetical protein
LENEFVVDVYLDVFGTSERIFCVVIEIYSHDVHWEVEQNEDFVDLGFLDVPRAVDDYGTLVFELFVRTVNEGSKEGIVRRAVLMRRKAKIVWHSWVVR